MESNMEYTFIKDYKTNSALRASFNELAATVFGIDFEQWYQLGFWNDRYICYSFVYHNQVVANVSANLMDLVVEGKRLKAIQIGTVMTHPDHRRRGLAEKLMHIVMKEYGQAADLIFLFGNPDAAGFYSRFDFQTVNETKYSSELILESSGYPTARKLDLSCNSDIGILKRLASERTAKSGIFGVEHAEGVLEWHCLYDLKENLSYIEALDALVICSEEAGTVELYDVVCRNNVDLIQIAGAILKEGAYQLNFDFTPDFKGIRVSRQPYKTSEYTFFVKPNRAFFPEEFFFPYTAHA